MENSGSHTYLTFRYCILTLNYINVHVLIKSISVEFEYYYIQIRKKSLMQPNQILDFMKVQNLFFCQKETAELSSVYH